MIPSNHVLMVSLLKNLVSNFQSPPPMNSSHRHQRSPPILHQRGTSTPSSRCYGASNIRRLLLLPASSDIVYSIEIPPTSDLVICEAWFFLCCIEGFLSKIDALWSSRYHQSM
ncbi:unnamed protein product [Lactuca virosa]|uniref:Uncharacterized protein n=1 Tax=Lactuca virosa TaxID=75947 RepID=A0AAU9N4L0_9ASTR|nr:unnamed protein product [Lactuca virosa]